MKLNCRFRCQCTSSSNSCVNCLDQRGNIFNCQQCRCQVDRRKLKEHATRVKNMLDRDKMERQDVYRIYCRPQEDFDSLDDYNEYIEVSRMCSLNQTSDMMYSETDLRAIHWTTASVCSALLSRSRCVFARKSISSRVDDQRLVGVIWVKGQ